MTRTPWLLAASLAAAWLSPLPVGARAGDKPNEPILLGEHAKPVNVVLFSPDGNTVAASDDDGIIKLWDVPTRKARASMEMPRKFVRALAFSPDGKTLASGDKNRNVQLWDAATGKALGAPLDQGRSVWALAFSPDGKTLASAGNGDKVRLWDVATGKQAAVISLPNAVVVNRLTFSPSGKQLAAEAGDVLAGGVNVRLCDVKNAREYANLPGGQPA
jgi:WD40 repeat protein